MIPKSSQIPASRKNAIRALVFEAAFSVFCIPLVELKSGLTIFSTVLNVFFLVFIAVGLYGSLRLNLMCVVFHCSGVGVLVGFLFIYLILTACFTTSESSEIYLYVIIALIGVVNACCVFFTMRLAWFIWRFSKYASGIQQQREVMPTSYQSIPARVLEADQNPMAREHNRNAQGNLHSQRHDGLSDNAILEVFSSMNSNVSAQAQAASLLNKISNSFAQGLISAADETRLKQQLATSNNLPQIEKQLAFLLGQKQDTPETKGELPPRISKAQSSGSERVRNCKICFEADINTVLLPCGHMVSCLVCSRKIRDCPICRKKIAQIQQVYAS